MSAEAIVVGSAIGKLLVDEGDMCKYPAEFNRLYWPTYKVLDIL